MLLLNQPTTHSRDRRASLLHNLQVFASRLVSEKTEEAYEKILHCERPLSAAKANRASEHVGLVKPLDAVLCGETNGKPGLPGIHSCRGRPSANTGWCLATAHMRRKNVPPVSTPKLYEKTRSRIPSVLDLQHGYMCCCTGLKKTSRSRRTVAALLSTSFVPLFSPLRM